MWDESGPEFLLVLYIMQFDGFLMPLGKIFWPRAKYAVKIPLQMSYFLLYTVMTA